MTLFYVTDYFENCLKNGMCFPYMGREKFGISLKSLSEICKSLGKFWKIFRKIPKIYQKFGVSVMTSSLAKPPPSPSSSIVIIWKPPPPPKVMTSYVNDPL